MDDPQDDAMPGLDVEPATTTAASGDEGASDMAKKAVARKPRATRKSGTSKASATRKAKAKSASTASANGARPSGVLRAGKKGSVVVINDGIAIMIESVQYALDKGLFAGEATRIETAQRLLARAQSRA